MKSTDNLSGKRILLIEDGFSAGTAIKNALEEAGARADVANGGETSAGNVLSDPPDIIGVNIMKCRARLIDATLAFIARGNGCGARVSCIWR